MASPSSCGERSLFLCCSLGLLSFAHWPRVATRSFAEAIGDDARMLRSLVQAGEWNQALQQLARANSTELYYHFSPALMAHVPKSTVDAWINSRVPLEPRKLLPALMHYSPAQVCSPSPSRPSVQR